MELRRGFADAVTLQTYFPRVLGSNLESIKCNVLFIRTSQTFLQTFIKHIVTCRGYTWRNDRFQFGWLDFISTSVTSSQSHYDIAIPHTVQSLFTLILSESVFTIHCYLSEPHCASSNSLFNCTHTLPISLHYGTRKVFKSHATSSQANFNCELPAALTAKSSDTQLPSIPTARNLN
jgi:hypothetical protein